MIIHFALMLMAGAIDQPAAANSKPITVVGEKRKKVCESFVPTGSVLPQRICRTEEEQEHQTERAIQYKENVVEQGDVAAMIQYEKEHPPR